MVAKSSYRNRIVCYLCNSWELYVMLIPCVVLLLIFNYLPMYGLTLAFKEYNPMQGIFGSPWVGLKHFQELFGDPYFIKVIGNTLRISFLKILCGFPVPIILAILMNEMKNAHFKKTVQTVIYLPYFISWVIIAGMLFDIFSMDNGAANKLLGMIGLGPVNFFGNSRTFLTMIIASDIWKSAGWGTIIYFAAISNINSELYEAAIVDGANRLQKIIYIILPGIRPAVSICLIFSVSGIMYAGFDQVFNLYNELVYSVADIIDTYIYRIGITDGKYGIATTLGLFNSVVSLALIILANKVIKKLGGDGIW